ncbi:MAG TPA: hypothetical protein VKG63_07435 [Steroidobacteraceae bacterium]|nr:hypothetical protein [Steroidobacteraceae bacterium]
MSGYLTRLVDRTLSRHEFIRPRPVALFGEPVAGPEWQLRDPTPREVAARGHEEAPRNKDEVPRDGDGRPPERETAARTRDALTASDEGRAGRVLATAHIASAMHGPQPQTQSLRAEPEDGRAAARPVSLQFPEPDAAHRDEPSPSPRQPTAARVEPNTAEFEVGEEPRRAPVRRESRASIVPVDAGPLPAARRRHAAVDADSVIERAPPGQGELSPPPQTRVSAPDATHKTLQGRRSAMPVDAPIEHVSALPGILSTRAVTTVPAGKRSQRSIGRSAESSTVHVTIGTLEVRANTPAAQPPAKPPAAKGPRLGLDQYLRQRRDGGRG